MAKFVTTKAGRSMGNKNLRRQYCRNILIRLFIVAIVAIGLVIWQRDFLAGLYLRNQLTFVGWIVNGGILILFIGGLSRIAQLLYRYMGEEAALARFLTSLQRDIEPTEHIRSESLIGTRYGTLKQLYSRRSPINQNALAAAMVAEESSHLSLPKFVNNVLILTGVFGTIISLSIALLGASDMLGSATREVGGLDTVIHGMSTALSTTMTAIFCYLIFGYFYLKLTDAQTYLIGRIEHITATYLVPRFVAQPESVLVDFSDLVRAATGLMERIEQAHERFAESANNLESVLRDFRRDQEISGVGLEQIGQLLDDGFRESGAKLGGVQNALELVDMNMDRTRRLLREGFRLPEEEP
ncbi:MAG: MotA/TolQ/ExbB proton channel family protein [Gammaproteobacteria bacterium]|nr:MotA/TolQ/ExbB proton channel family protein [Gammaproteobacteria bacterium]